MPFEQSKLLLAFLVLSHLYSIMHLSFFSKFSFCFQRFLSKPGSLTYRKLFKTGAAAVDVFLTNIVACHVAQPLHFLIRSVNQER